MKDSFWFSLAVCVPPSSTTHPTFKGGSTHQACNRWHGYFLEKVHHVPVRKHGPVSRGLNCILGITNFLFKIVTSSRKLIWTLTLNPSRGGRHCRLFHFCIPWNIIYWFMSAMKWAAFGESLPLPLLGRKVANWLYLISCLFHQNNLSYFIDIA